MEQHNKSVSAKKRRRVIGKITCCRQNKCNSKDKEIKEQLFFLQTLIDAIPNPIFYKDVQGIYRGCNKAFETYSGLTKQQIVDKNVFEVFPAEIANKCHQMDSELFATQGVQVYDSRLTYADGSIHIIEVNKATYVDMNNKVAGLVGVITDITERTKDKDAIKEGSRKLYCVLEQIVQAMAVISETRDLYTAGHQHRVAELATAIARELKLSEDSVKSIQVAGMLHDIGKIAVPAELLIKPNKLTTNEFGIIKEHCEVGYNILKRIDFPWPISEIVYQHHERLDGSGYPRGLRQEDILLEAQVIAVADVVEAMYSHRPYRPSLGLEQAVAEINMNKGNLYNADVVAACCIVLERGWPF